MDGSAGCREALECAVAHAELSGAGVQAAMAWQLPIGRSMASHGANTKAYRVRHRSVIAGLSPTLPR